MIISFWSPFQTLLHFLLNSFYRFCSISSFYPFFIFSSPLSSLLFFYFLFIISLNSSLFFFHLLILNLLFIFSSTSSLLFSWSFYSSPSSKDFPSFLHLRQSFLNLLFSVIFISPSPSCILSSSSLQHLLYFSYIFFYPVFIFSSSSSVLLYFLLYFLHLLFNSSPILLYLLVSSLHLLFIFSLSSSSILLYLLLSSLCLLFIVLLTSSSSSSSSPFSFPPRFLSWSLVISFFLLYLSAISLSLSFQYSPLSPLFLSFSSMIRQSSLNSSPLTP